MAYFAAFSMNFAPTADPKPFFSLVFTKTSMKQTNNAIKFLMAQYRAIFKNAYFKGLTSAVLLTAGLSVAGGAQATNFTEADLTEGLAADQTITIDGAGTEPDTYKYIQVKSGGTSYTDPVAINGTIDIIGGKISESNPDETNYINNSGAGLHWAGNGTLNINIEVDGSTVTTSNVTTYGLGVKTASTTASSDDDKAVNINIGAVNVVRGGLTLANSGGVATGSSVSVAAQNITVGESAFPTGVTATQALITLGDGSSQGAVRLGAKTDRSKVNSYDTTITVNRTGKIEFKGRTDADEVTLAGSALNVNGGALSFTNEGIIQVDKGEFNDGTFTVENTGKATFDLNAIGNNADLSNAVYEVKSGTVELKGHSTNDVGTLLVKAGTLALTDDVELTSTGSNGNSGGVITLDAENTDTNRSNVTYTAKDAVLKLGSTTLKNFLTDATLEEGTTDIAGQIDLSKGTIEFTDNVDLAKVIGANTISTAGGNGKIKVSGTLGNSVIAGDELTISSTLGANANKLTVKANTLNLTEQAGGLGVGETVAEKYVLKLVSGSDSAYTVDKVHSYAAVLENQPNPFYDETDGTNFAESNKTVNLAGTGTIDNNLIMSGASATTGVLNVYAGHYTDSHDITLASGSISIGGATSTAHTEYAGIDASLTLSGSQLILDNTSGDNTITVAGNSGDVTFGSTTDYKHAATAVLDLTGAGLNIKGDASHLSKFNVNAHGILRITTEQALDILNTHGDRDASTTSGAGILISGGTVEVAGDLYDRDAEKKGIKVTALQSGAAADTDKITFTTDKGGILTADSITLYSTADTEVLDIGSKGVLESDSITLNQTALNDKNQPLDFQVKSGVLNVGESLNGSANQIILGAAGSSSAEVNLGYISADMDPTHGIRADLTTYTTSADTGSVNVDLKLNGKAAYVSGQEDTSDLNIVYGAWTVQDIDATNATITVGSSGDEVDANGELYKASLTGQGLTLGTGTQMTVRSNGAATFETLALKGGNVTVENTTLTINGDYQAEVKDDPTTNGNEAKPESWGLETSAGTINVTGRKGQLILGADAVQGVKTTLTDGKYVYSNANDDQSAFVALSGYATLALGLSSDVTFDKTSLQELRKDFISGSDGLATSTHGFIDIGDAKIEGIVPSNGTISWNGQNNAAGLKDYSDIIADILQNDLKDAVLVDVGAGDTVQANVGAIVVDGSANAVTLDNTNLYNAAANSGNFFSNESSSKPIDAIINSGAQVSLNNGGNTGAIQLKDGTDDSATTLAVVSSAVEGTTAPVTNIENLRGLGDNTSFEVSGVTNITRNLEIGTLEVNDALTINGTTSISNGLTSREDADGNLVTTGSLNAVGALTVEGGVDYAGNITASGTATFGAADGSDTNEYYFAGNNTFKDVNLYNGAEFDKGVTTAETMTIGDGMEIYGGASVKANVLQFTANITDKWISVGEPAGKDKATGEEWESSNGYLTVGRLDLAGNTLVTDPDWSKPASIVAIGQLGSETAVTSALGNDAGTLDGSLVALQNSILAIGVTDSTETDGDTAIEQIQQTFATYLNDNGALSADGVGAIAYVAKAMDLGADDKIVVDASRNAKQYQDLMDGTSTNTSAADTAFKTAVNGNNAYIGANSVLAFGNAALNATSTDGTTTTDRAALHFDDDAASIFGAGGKIVLTGGEFNTIDEVLLFTDNGTGEHNGVTIAADGQDIRVESLSGLYYMTLEAGTETTGGELMLNHSRLNEVFTSASTPVKNSLVAYAERNNNWADGNAKVDRLVGDLRRDVTYNPTTNTFTDAKGTTLDSNRFVAIEQTDGQGAVTGYTVYDEADNAVLDYTVMYDASGATAETTARMGAYAGVAQAALAAGASTYDSISSRMGIGAQSSTMTFAENGQGAGLWLNPIYKSHDSDSFDAEGVDYGVDMNLYGVALGADYTLANGLRFGAMFNVGSGDADGQGAGSAVSNDFDYYGFGAFVGYTMGALSVVGDVSYTAVDNDVEANLPFDKVGASLDSTNFSVGVTGKYELDFNGVSVAPHAGLRYSSIDIDDYSVDGQETYAHFSAQSMDVFSIPVGVTIAKDIVAGNWTVKPSFDLTLTGNFGDDEFEGDVDWEGVSNLVTQTSTEVLDNFTYGATLGVAAQTGNFSLGLGVNYTGSSNVDEFGVNANARFVF